MGMIIFRGPVTEKPAFDADLKIFIIITENAEKNVLTGIVTLTADILITHFWSRYRRFYLATVCKRYVGPTQFSNSVLLSVSLMIHFQHVVASLFSRVKYCCKIVTDHLHWKNKIRFEWYVAVSHKRQIWHMYGRHEVLGNTPSWVPALTCKNVSLDNSNQSYSFR